MLPPGDVPPPPEPIASIAVDDVVPPPAVAKHPKIVFPPLALLAPPVPIVTDALAGACETSINFSVRPPPPPPARYELRPIVRRPLFPPAPPPISQIRTTLFVPARMLPALSAGFVHVPLAVKIRRSSRRRPLVPPPKFTRFAALANADSPCA